MKENEADCGPSTPDSFASYDPDTSSWRTSQLSLLEDSGEFSETWPRAGMTRSGTAYPLPPLAPLTDVTGSGWSRIPTPTVGDSKNARNSTAVRHRLPPTGIHAGDTLTDYVTMWPTPTAADSERSGNFARGNPTLAGAVKRWPTPSARDYRSPNRLPYSERGGGKKGEQLPNAVGGALNPTWVEWLMGYPLGWTVCEGWATRSSRKSPSGIARRILEADARRVAA